VIYIKNKSMHVSEFNQIKKVEIKKNKLN